MLNTLLTSRHSQLTKEVPKEDCTIEPQQECKNVSTLLPMLVWEQQCADVPNEVCSKKRVNPRRQERPIIRKWCEKKRGKLFVLNHGVPDADDTSKPRPILNVIDLKSGAVQCSRQLPVNMLFYFLSHNKKHVLRIISELGQNGYEQRLIRFQ